MAIAFDAATNNTGVSGTSTTYNVTLTGSNLALIIGGVGDSVSDFWTGITVDGVSMTRIYGALLTGDRYTYLYYLAGLTSGTKSVVISASSSTVLNNYNASYTGVAAGGVTAQNATLNHALNTDWTVSVTTVDDNSWVAGFARGLGSANLSNGASTAIRTTTSSTGEADSNADVTPAGARALHITADVGLVYNFLAVAMSPFVAGAVSTRTTNFSLLGVGT